MKRLILAALPALLLATAAVLPAQAQVTAAAPPTNAETVGMAVTPFNLVFLAYQGFFESEGIPKFASLAAGFENGSITPESLIQVAVKMERLTPDAPTNRTYIAAVRHQLRSLTMDNSGN
jgi:hypothetical protein